MVTSGVSEGKKPQNFMAMNPERLRPLHNFSMPSLKWGNQRLLRCRKENSNGEISCFERRSSASEAESEGLEKYSESLNRRSSNSFESFRKSSPLSLIRKSGRKTEIERDRDEGIEAVREKLMFHLCTAADTMKFSIPEEAKEEESCVPVERQWNLRMRRAACKAPDETRRRKISSIDEEQKHKYSPKRTEIPTKKSLRLRGLAADQGVEKKERRKFSISLSRDEIEEDFVAMTGKKLSRRPKKKLKIIQKQLDKLFPGLWLSEITEDSYKIPDEPDTRKN